MKPRFSRISVLKNNLRHSRLGRKMVNGWGRLLSWRDLVGNRLAHFFSLSLPKIDPIAWVYRMRAKFKRLELIDVPYSNYPSKLYINRKTAANVSEIRLHENTDYNLSLRRSEIRDFSISVHCGSHGGSGGFLFSMSGIETRELALELIEEIRNFLTDFSEGRTPTVVIRDWKSPIVEIRRVG